MYCTRMNQSTGGSQKIVSACSFHNTLVAIFVEWTSTRRLQHTIIINEINGTTVKYEKINHPREHTTTIRTPRTDHGFNSYYKYLNKFENAYST